MQRLLAGLLRTIVADYELLTNDLGILYWFQKQREIVDEIPNQSAILTYLDLRNHLCGTKTTDEDQQILNLFERKLQ